MDKKPCQHDTLRCCGCGQQITQPSLPDGIEEWYAYKDGEDGFMVTDSKVSAPKYPPAPTTPKKPTLPLEVQYSIAMAERALALDDWRSDGPLEQHCIIGFDGKALCTCAAFKSEHCQCECSSGYINDAPELD